MNEYQIWVGGNSCGVNVQVRASVKRLDVEHEGSRLSVIFYNTYYLYIILKVHTYSTWAPHETVYNSHTTLYIL